VLQGCVGGDADGNCVCFIIIVRGRGGLLGLVEKLVPEAWVFGGLVLGRRLVNGLDEPLVVLWRDFFLIHRMNKFRDREERRDGKAISLSGVLSLFFGCSDVNRKKQRFVCIWV
jgi:hypothetical protein